MSLKLYQNISSYCFHKRGLIGLIQTYDEKMQWLIVNGLDETYWNFKRYD